MTSMLIAIPLFMLAVTGLALVLSLLIYMRNVVGVVTPLLTSTVAAIWGFGFVGWLGDPIEPLIMVVLGTVIGGLVIALYLPIFQLGSVVSGH